MNASTIYDTLAGNCADDASVRLRNPAPRPPATDVESFAVDLLAKEAMTFGELVSRVAALLYRKELRAGAWAVDIGLFGSSLFIADALRGLEAGSGELWEVG